MENKASFNFISMKHFLSQEAPLHRGVFDPVGQHRDWCPWVTVVSGDTLGETQLTKPQPTLPEAEHPLQAWKAALHLLLSMKKPDNTAESSMSQVQPHTSLLTVCLKFSHVYERSL